MPISLRKGVHFFILKALFFLVSFTFAQQSDCGSSFIYKDNFIHSQTAEFISNYTCKEKIYCHEEQFRRTPGVLFINGSEPGQQFVFCISTKAGFMRTRQLLYKIQNKDYDGRYSGEIFNAQQYHPLNFMNMQQVTEILENKSLPKIVFVRNPFIRAISMYQDKIRHKERQQQMLGMDPTKGISFQAFIEQLYYRLNNKVAKYDYVDHHYIPQYQFCKYDVGMSYNYVLKIEEMDDWFDCFVDLVNIRNDVMHGWPDHDSCFLSTSKTPCHGVSYKNGRINDNNKTNALKGHVTNSSSKIAHYYQNQTIVQMVADIFQDDIIHFNYRIFQV
eukprot:TRINITY_DN7099_c0_g3_i2.p1 TRINITY_DN7099_c0_g3~~TRINITY_DN7099_c0_g3_i2.p1  ORF type:complete len:331 (+),score=22.13 TRINITY_DN7099_c0_g3_i2:354-1346(+)